MTDFPPWDLAWHPHIDSPQDERPLASLFATPDCSGMGTRPSGGLWTSPWIEPLQVSFWSMRHDREESGIHDVRRGWLVSCPPRSRTAILDTADDIARLVQRFPCQRHRHDLPKSFAYRDLLATQNGRDHLWPPLDYVRLRATYDAVYVTLNCLESSEWKSPGVIGFEVPTFLWLRPVWKLLKPLADVVHLADMATAAARRLGRAHPE